MIAGKQISFKHHILLALAAILLLMGTLHATAKEIAYSSYHVSFEEIKKSASLYFPKTTVAQEDITTGQLDNLFKPYGELESYIISADNVWVKFPLHYNCDQAENILIHLGGRYNNEIDAFIIDSSNAVSTYHTGCYVPLSLQTLPNDRNYQNIKVQIRPNETYWVYVNYRNFDKKPITPTIYTSTLDGWYNHLNNRNVTQGIFQGAIWLLLFYHLFIFLVGRDRQYIPYIIYLVALSTYFLNYYSFLLEWIFPERPTLFLPFYIISTSLVPISYLFFLKTTLSGDRLNMLFLKMINGWIVVRSIEAILMLITIYSIYDFELVHEIHRGFALFETFFFLLLMLFYKQTSDAASPFIIWGTIFLHIGIFISIVSSSKWGLVEQGNYFFEMGALLEVFIFALGLGYRNRKLALAEKEVQKKYIEQLQINETLIKDREITLQQQVEERTKELEDKKEELSKLNQELTQLSDVKDKMLSILSHDARLPLTNLRLMIELYQTHELPEEEMKQLMNEINISIDQSIQLMENLIFWTKANSNGIKIYSEKTDVSITVYSIAEQLKTMFINKNITFKYTKHEPLFGYFDAYTVQIILRNLIHNALKYTNAGGKVEIRQVAKNDFIAIEIIDNGTGIDETILQQVEENALRKSSAGTNKESGTGMGLSLCFEFARLNKGFLEIKSKRNQGTTIALHLPR